MKTSAAFGYVLMTIARNNAKRSQTNFSANEMKRGSVADENMSGGGAIGIILKPFIAIFYKKTH